MVFSPTQRPPNFHRKPSQEHFSGPQTSVSRGGIPFAIAEAEPGAFAYPTSHIAQSPPNLPGSKATERTTVERSFPRNSGDYVPVGQRVSGFMRSSESSEEEPRSNRPRMSVMSRLSRTMDENAARRSNTLSIRRPSSSLRGVRASSAISHELNGTTIAEAPEELVSEDMLHKLTNWVNRYLLYSGIRVTDLVQDMRNPNLIIRFIEELSGRQITSVLPEAYNTVQTEYDMNQAFQFLQILNVKVDGIDPDAILAGHEGVLVKLMQRIQQTFPSSVPADFYE
jgi:hypothetical protein